MFMPNSDLVARTKENTLFIPSSPWYPSGETFRLLLLLKLCIFSWKKKTELNIQIVSFPQHAICALKRESYDRTPGPSTFFSRLLSLIRATFFPSNFQPIWYYDECGRSCAVPHQLRQTIYEINKYCSAIKSLSTLPFYWLNYAASAHHIHVDSPVVCT